MSNFSFKRKKIVSFTALALILLIAYNTVSTSSAFLTDKSGGNALYKTGKLGISRVDTINDPSLPSELIAGVLYDLSISFRNDGNVPANLNLAMMPTAVGQSSHLLINQIEIYYNGTLLTGAKEIVINNIQPQQSIRVPFQFKINSNLQDNITGIQTLGVNIRARFAISNNWRSNIIQGSFSSQYSRPKELFTYDPNFNAITGFNQAYINSILGGVSPTQITIPSSYGGNVVTSIAANAFMGKNLNSVTLPSTMTTIGNNAFRNNNLSQITIPDSVTSIGNNAFDGNRSRMTLYSNIIYANDAGSNIRGWTPINRASRSTTSTDHRKFIAGISSWDRWGTRTTNSMAYNSSIGRNVMNIKSTGTGSQYNGILTKLNGYIKGETYRVVITARTIYGNNEIETIVWTQPGLQGKNPQFNAVIPLSNTFETFYYEFDSSTRGLDRDMILHIGGIVGPYEFEVAEAYLEYIGSNPISPTVGVPNGAQQLVNLGGNNYGIPGMNRFAMINDEMAAELAVELAEETKNQEDLNTARDLVTLLLKSEFKDELNKRLDVLQDEIYKQNEKNVIIEVELAEETRNQEDLDIAREEIDKLPDGELKDELNKRLDVLQDEIYKQNEIIAEAAVELAEQTRTQEDLDIALILVEEMPDSDKKEEFIERLKVVQNEIGPLDLTSEIAVEKAEQTGSQENLDLARKLIDDMLDSDRKEELSNRLDVLQEMINERNAEIAVELAEITASQESLNLAIDLVEILSESDFKNELNNRLNLLSNIINAVNQVKETLTQENLDYAIDMIEQLLESVRKEEIVEMLKLLQEELNAELAVQQAEETGLQEDLDEALYLVDNLPDSYKKEELIERLNILQVEIEGEFSQGVDDLEENPIIDPDKDIEDNINDELDTEPGDNIEDELEYNPNDEVDDEPEYNPDTDPDENVEDNTEDELDENIEDDTNTETDEDSNIIVEDDLDINSE